MNRVEWTKEESEAVIRGCTTYGYGNWAMMLADRTIFAALHPHHRDNVKLKDHGR